MLGDLELGLLSRIVLEGSTLKATKNGVNSTFFKNPKYRSAWEFISKHSNNSVTRNQAPSAEYFQAHTGVTLLDPKNLPEIGEIVRRLNNRNIRSIINMGLIAVNDIMEKNPEQVDKALSVLTRMNKDLNSSCLPTHQQMDLIDAVPNYLEAYETMSSAEGMAGLPFPYEILNKGGLGGLIPGLFYVTYAPSKAGKTWFGCLVGAVYPFLNSARVLVVSMEMSVTQMWRRMLSIIAQLDYSGVTSGDLSLEAKDVMYDQLNTLQSTLLNQIRSDMQSERYADMRVVKPNSSNSGVNFIRQEIDKFQPDIVFVDGIYLLSDDRQKGKRDSGWKTITNITQDVKLLAGELNIPIFATAQANREGAKKKAHSVGADDWTDIAGAVGLVQDADVVFRLHKIKSNAGNASKILVTLPAIRETKIESFIINFKPCTDFSVHAVNISKEDIKQLVLDDEDEAPSAMYNFSSNNSGWK